MALARYGRQPVRGRFREEYYRKDQIKEQHVNLILALITSRPHITEGEDVLKVEMDSRSDHYTVSKRCGFSNTSWSDPRFVLCLSSQFFEPYLHRITLLGLAP